MACERNLSERKNARLGNSSYELFYISWLVLQEDKLKARGTHTPLHGLASNSRMASTSPGQWQPWTAVSPLLALRSRKFLIHFPCACRGRTAVRFPANSSQMCCAELALKGVLCRVDEPHAVWRILLCACVRYCPGRGLMYVCPFL